MSMLAERKVKQKWSLNPRGNDWADDHNKFGQKMLEKMGWSKGKGLGSSLQGMTENLKVKYKNDSRGIGHKVRDDQWTEHEDQFATLLKALSSQVDENIVKIEKRPSASLVDKSKNLKARIHYKKFTKGKDLTQYSEKDLANVFGRKQLKKEKHDEEKEVGENEDDEKFRKGGSMTDYFKKKMGANQLGPTCGFSIGKNGVLKKDSDSEEERPSFGFGFKNKNYDDNKDKINSTNVENNEQEARLGFSFSGFKKGFGFKTNSNQDHQKNGDVSNDKITGGAQNERLGFGFINFTKSNSVPEKNNENSIESKNAIPETNGSLQMDEWLGKTKKKKNGVVHVDLNGENSFIEKDEEEENNNSHVDLNGETYMHNGKSSKKKRKNKGLDSSISKTDNSEMKNKEVNSDKNNFDSSKSTKINDESNKNDLSNSELSESKKKKKKIREHTKEMSIDDNNTEEESMTRSSKKKNKKKNKDKSVDSSVIKDSEVVNTPKKKNKKNVEETPTFVSYISETVSMENLNLKKRRLEEADDKTPKKKKNKAIEVGLSNPGFDPVFHTPPMERHNLNTINEANDNEITEETLDSQASITSVEVEENSREKKKKKKKDKTAVDCDESSNQVVVEDEQDKKKKSKKRKLEEIDGGVENVCFNSLDESRVEEEEVVENPYEVKPKKKKKSKSKDKDDSLNQVEAAQTKPKETSGPAGIDNPALNLTPLIEEDIQCDLLLNTTTEKPKAKALQRRKSVTFSENNQEHIIPNREQLARQTELFEINTQILEESLKKKRFNKVPEGIDNEAFSAMSEREQEKLRYAERFRYAVDTYELQVENALNERKSVLVGDVHSQLEEAVVHEEGVILPYKKASFMGVNYGYFKSDIESAKSGYKHFIRGDILVAFKNSNLHEITGYGIDVEKVLP